MQTEPFSYSGSELDALARNVHYYRWIVELFEPYVGDRVLEVGAGIGSFAAALLDACAPSRMWLVEPDADHVAALRRRFEDDRRIAVAHGFLDGVSEGLDADTIVAVNVLEHVEDDAGLLDRAHDLLAPGGHLLVYTPALEALYGPLDAAFGHHRRYSRDGLRELSEAAGFTVDLLRYMNLPGVLGWFATGKLLRRRSLAAWQVVAYDRLVVPWLSRLERRFEPPVGQGLVLVGRR